MPNTLALLFTATKSYDISKFLLHWYSRSVIYIVATSSCAKLLHRSQDPLPLPMRRGVRYILEQWQISAESWGTIFTSLAHPRAPYRGMFQLRRESSMLCSRIVGSFLNELLYSGKFACCILHHGLSSIIGQIWESSQTQWYKSL